MGLSRQTELFFTKNTKQVKSTNKIKTNEY